MRKTVSLLLLLSVLLCGCRKEPAPATDGSTAPSDIETTAPVVTLPPATEPIVTEPPPTETQPPLTGWQELDGKRYFYTDEGIPHTGWLEWEDHRYYFLSDGTMVIGKVLIDGVNRYFTTSGKEIILVNPWNFVPEDYEVQLSSCQGWPVAADCVDDLKQMLRDCATAGHNAVIVSGHRTHAVQKYLYQNRIDRFIAQGYSPEKAAVEAAKRVAYPGTSEHELGLAVDIVDKEYQKLNNKQETMPTQQWLMENCWKYGFILRYPNHKSDATGIIYEPWHYRYVGRELAQELHGTDLCLEEYLQSITVQ